MEGDLGFHGDVPKLCQSAQKGLPSDFGIQKVASNAEELRFRRKVSDSLMPQSVADTTLLRLRAAIQSFDPIHRSIQILAQGLITALQLAQRPQPVFPVIDRPQHAGAQRLAAEKSPSN